MKVYWALLCERLITDVETNNASLIEIIEEISVPTSPPGIVTRPNELPQHESQPQVPPESQPQVPPGSVPGRDEKLDSLLSFWVVVLWARSDYDAPEKGQSRIRMVTPGGREWFSGEYEVDLTQAPRARAAGRMVGFPSTSEGEHILKVEARTAVSGWSEEFEIPVWVRIQAGSPSG